MAKEKFDYDKFKEEAREKLKSGGSLLGKEGALTSLLKDFGSSLFSAHFIIFILL